MIQRFPLVMRFCSCTDSTGSSTQLGHRQKEYEDLLKSGLAPAESLDRMGLVRMCCRDAFLNPPHLFLMDSNTGRFRDETGLVNQTTLSAREQVTIIDGPVIEPRIPLPPLPS
jgi:DNA-directed RNA polymerase subunit N (RpoN/RPB10)